MGKPTDEQQPRQPKPETPKTAEKPPRKAPKKAKKANGTAPEAVVVPPGRVEPEPDKATSATEAADAIDEEGPISEAAEELQTELQTYALDLLDGNASWERKKVIQNLVIWEPVTDPTLLAMPSNAVVPGTVSGSSGSVNVQSASPSSRKGKNKKVRKRQSGLDFNRKRSMGKGSRDVSRAHSPVQSSEDQSSKEVIHTLANVMTDSRHMVLDRSAGETILHRAAKMGYPDVTAYALDMAKMSAVVKDNAGFPPLHKAALKGHAEIVDYLIRYGADPNTNVKGTRPLHEALEGGHLGTVLKLLRHGSDPLLYDYSGNMPIDLAKESEDKQLLDFFSAILKDLHGKPAPRWNVSHDRSFVLPQGNELDLPKRDSNLVLGLPESDEDDDDDDLEFEFEVSSQPLPPQFMLPQHPDEKFVLATDLKRFTSLDLTKLMGKLNTIKMAREDFIKSAYCCLLGASVDPTTKQDHVVLVKADSQLKKITGCGRSKIVPQLKCQC